LAELIGVLTYTCPAISYGPLYTRALEFDKTFSLQASKGQFASRAFLSQEAISDLRWWLSNIMTSSRSLLRDNYIGTVTTDSSNTSWGSTFGEESTKGNWCYTDLYDMGRKRHINELAMLAIFNGLKTHTRDLTNVSIVDRTDSTTALSYVVRRH